jgi:hypothetical protein
VLSYAVGERLGGEHSGDEELLALQQHAQAFLAKEKEVRGVYHSRRPG